MTEDTESVDLNNVRGTENNMLILEPDIGLGDRIANRIGRGNDHPRREEGTISFRRFLQNDRSTRNSNRSTHPDLYSCSRQGRSDEGAPSIDPESPDLPDFVQDHLAVEQMYFNDNASPAGANLPDFASFINLARRGEDESNSDDDERRRCRNREPLDLPVPNFLCNNSSNDRSGAGLRLPCDLTTDSEENNIGGNSNRLPDFLSDGHIFGPDNNPSHSMPTSSQNHVDMTQDLERISVSMLERDNERLREELQILRSALLKKDDRIKELEDIVMALEISKLQMHTDANTQTCTKSHDNEGSASSEPKIDHPKSSEVEKLEAFSNPCINNGPSEVKVNPNLAHKVKEMTSVSERLVRELLRIITDFQVNIDEEDPSSKGVSDKAAANSGKVNDNSSSSSSSMNSNHPR